LQKEINLYANQQQDFFPVATESHSLVGDGLLGDSEKAFSDDTFDEWRGSFTAVLLISMICGKFFTVTLRNKRLKRCVQS